MVAFACGVRHVRPMVGDALSLFDLDNPDAATVGQAVSQTVPVLMPLALNDPYDYLVPAHIPIQPGDFVVVP